MPLCNKDMKGAIETAIGIVFLAFMAVLGTSYVTVSLNTQRAQNYHASVVQELENSGFSQNVIDEEIEKADQNGYGELKIEKKVSSGTGEAYAKVTLPYKYAIPILGINWDHEIVGYAR